MSIELEREELRLLKCITVKNLSFWLENEIVVPDKKPDIVKVLRVTAKSYISKKEVSEGKLKVDGLISYYVTYRSADPKKPIRGIYSIFPYTNTFIIPGLDPKMKVKVKIDVKNVLYTVPNERKINVKAELFGNVKTCISVPKKPIKKIKSKKRCEVLTESHSFLDYVESREETISSREELLLPSDMPNIGEILWSNFEIKDIEYKFSYNKVLVKGEMKISVVYVTDCEEYEIKKYKTTIPITAFIELKELRDACSCNVDLEVNDFCISLGENNSLYCDYETTVLLDVLQNRQIEYITDAYGIDNDIRLTATNDEVVKSQTEEKFEFPVRDSIEIKKLSDFTVCDFDFEVSNLDYRFNNSSFEIEGTIRCNALMRGGADNYVENKIIDIPIIKNIDLQKITNPKTFDVNWTYKNPKISTSGDNLDIEVIIDGCINSYDNCNCCFVDDVSCEDINEVDCDSIVIYSMKKNETIWDVAKKYRTTIDDISIANNIDKNVRLESGQSIIITR